METQFSFDQHLVNGRDDICLRDLASKLITTIQPTAARKNSLIINDISPFIMVTNNKNMLATVINTLLALIVSRNSYSCIRLTAKNFSNLVLFYVKDQNKSAKKISSSDIAGLQLLASKVGGCITISNQKESSETLALSFLDMAKVA